MKSQFALLKDRRFIPLFATQFTSAFNDNFFKTLLIVMTAYGVLQTAHPGMVVTLAAALFILPFVLVTPLGGDLADKYDKAMLARRVKMAEVVIIMFCCAGIMISSLSMMMTALLALGVHSALFSPVKFSILPQHLVSEELVGANALLNTGSYLAILGGTIMGSLLALDTVGHYGAIVVLIFSSVAGYAASRFIPVAPPPSPEITVGWNTAARAVDNIRQARDMPGGVFTALLGSAWFFFVGATYLTQLPAYASAVLNVNNEVLTLFLVVFSLGISLGGLLNNRLLNGKADRRFTPIAALGIGMFSLLFPVFTALWTPAVTMMNPYDFLQQPLGWGIFLALLAVSICGGLFIVPLKAVVQERCPKDRMARIISAGALIDASFILSSAVLAALFLAAGLQVQDLFGLCGVASIAVACLMLRSGKE